MSLRVESLGNFVALADTGNMTAAAAALHISQPALSRQMAVLEAEMGCELYRREDGAIKLTQEGRVLYGYATSIAELAERAREDVATAAGAVAGSVYVGYGETSALTLVAEAIRMVRDRHPDVVFHMTAGDSGELIDQLNRGSLDFMLECGVKARGRFNTLELPGRDTWAAIMPAGHPLAARASVRAEDLAGCSIVVARQAWAGRALREWAGALYPNMSVATSFNLGASALAFVDAGVGIAIGYKELVEGLYGGRLACVPLDPPLYDLRGLVWRKDRMLTPAASAFLDQLKALVQSGGTGASG